jgi:gluconate kinase
MGRDHNGGDVNKPAQDIRLSDEQRLDWLRLIRSQNIGPRGIMAQTPEALLAQFARDRRLRHN